jgi:hypothetical protein
LAPDTATGGLAHAGPVGVAIDLAVVIMAGLIVAFSIAFSGRQRSRRHPG